MSRVLTINDLLRKRRLQRQIPGLGTVTLHSVTAGEVMEAEKASTGLGASGRGAFADHILSTIVIHPQLSLTQVRTLSDETLSALLVEAADLMGIREHFDETESNLDGRERLYVAYRRLMDSFTNSLQRWSLELAVPEEDAGRVVRNAISSVSIALKGILDFEGETDDGFIVEVVALPWREIVLRLQRDPHFLHEIGWRAMEELIAGAYKKYGCPEVILTPRSGDDGRDVIATWPGRGAIRIIDQVKAYRPGRVVSPDEVRSMLGVLSCEGNVSKGVITTTSDFAPSVRTNPKVTQFMPYRLELVNGKQLLDWLLGTAEHSLGTDASAPLK